MRFDRNRYSVHCRAAGKLVSLRAYARGIVVVHQGEFVAEHARAFGRDKSVYDPWHYVPTLTRKPGALRNGAPFQDWELPAGLARVRKQLAKAQDGDRQFVAILAAALQDGLGAVECACEQALGQGVVSADAVLNLLARSRDSHPVAVAVPTGLQLTVEPSANVARYDTLLGCA